MGFPGGSAGKESTCNAGDMCLNPWVGKIPWTPVFWSGEFHGQYSPWGHRESDMTDFEFHFHTKVKDIIKHMWFKKVIKFNKSITVGGL